ncbi:MAG: hypothetical protein ACPF9D_03440 [Owenweeksia sp.]
MKKFWIVSILCLAGLAGYAQTPSDSLPEINKGSKSMLIKPFTVEAKVISFLQGHDNLAVLQVTRAGENPWNLQANDEILVTFLIALKDSKKAGSGDLISAQVIGSMNKNTVQVDYRILKYVVLASPIESSEVPSTSGSQK